MTMSVESDMRAFTRIAVINRGEAAMRLIRAVREYNVQNGLSLETVAFVTAPDLHARFAREADAVVRIDPPPGLRAAAAYLDADRLHEAIVASGADAVWVGWGFVAEDPAFAERIARAGVTFIGPPPEAMRIAGDKIAAKRMAESCGVPVVPWSGAPVESLSDAREAAASIGFPVVLKAAAGGGGRGIRLVSDPTDLDEAFAAATAEAARAFGDGRLFIERHLACARHLEVQVAADGCGHATAFGVRDCSVQRRHQKVVEECPGPMTTPALDEALTRDALALVRRSGYRNLGTVEFLYDPATGSRWFMEINARLQVEHPVTELVYGIDLVKLQLDIARERCIADLRAQPRGAAIEVRINAEDPDRNFAPVAGEVQRLLLPAGPGVRVDADVTEHSVIPPDFDSMIAKVVTCGADRAEAAARMRRALAETSVVVGSCATNKPLLASVLGDQDFLGGRFDTGWLGRKMAEGAFDARPFADEALVAAAVQAYRAAEDGALANFYAAVARGIPHHPPDLGTREIGLGLRGRSVSMKVSCLDRARYTVCHDRREIDIRIAEEGRGAALLMIGGRRLRLACLPFDEGFHVEVEGVAHRVLRDAGGIVSAPAPSVVTDLAVSVGDVVHAGQRLATLEAMKMEMPLLADRPGRVSAVFVARNAQVRAGQPLLAMEPLGAEERAAAPVPSAEPFSIASSDDLFLEIFHGGDRPSGGVLDDPRPSRRQAIAAAVCAELRRAFLGFDDQPERSDRLLRLLDAEEVWEGLAHPGEYRVIGDLIAVFADTEWIFSGGLLPLGDGHPPVSTHTAFYEFARRLSLGAQGARPEFIPGLLRALSYYGIASLEPAPEIRKAVARLVVACGGAGPRTDLRHRLVSSLMRALLCLHRAGVDFSGDLRLAAALERLPQVARREWPFVADNAHVARYVLFLQARFAQRARAATTQADDDTLGLAEVPGDRLELWRLAEFDLEPMDAPAPLAIFHAQARTNPRDERIFVLGEVTAAGPGDTVDGTPESMIPFEHVYMEAVQALREIQSRRDARRRYHWNRIILFVRPVIVMNGPAVVHTSERLAAFTRGLGLEGVFIRARMADPARPREIAEVEVRVSNPTGHRLEVLFAPPGADPIHAATPYELKVQKARAIGVPYPYEVIRMITSQPDVRTFSEISFPPGRFIEYDLDGEPSPDVQPRAVPAGDRPFGENQAGVVFGIVSHCTEKHPEGMDRVLILSDPLREMGALAAPECARLVAAIDLAGEWGLPVEWIPISGGARIAMDSGTENLDWAARVLRRIIEFTQAGGEINVIVDGINVGAQSYFDAEATMLMHSRGVLIMTPRGAMVLTGKKALDHSGGVSAGDERGIGGYERIMGPNGQAQHFARDLAHAYGILLDHYRYTYIKPGEARVRPLPNGDPIGRDVTAGPRGPDDGEPFTAPCDIFSAERNPERKKPFAVRSLMAAVVDRDGGSLERFVDMGGAGTAVVWDCHLGGEAVCMVGFEGRPLGRQGWVPGDGPESWSGGTLFPQSSKKVARALNAASGNRPVVVLANLSGFDGSPESLRLLQLEYGAEIGRAVVNFRGPLIFCVVARYHGGAYVVFSKALNENLKALAVEGAFASVIGGAPAAAIVFSHEVRARTDADDRVREARRRVEASPPERRPRLKEEMARIHATVLAEKQAGVAAEFDRIHSVRRALEAGSLDEVVPAKDIRLRLCELIAAVHRRRPPAADHLVPPTASPNSIPASARSWS